MTKPLMTLENVTKVYKSKDFQGKVHEQYAVNGVSLTIYQGETLGLVGESGSGKSTLGKLLLNFEMLTSGKIERHLKDDKSMQIIFQDPYASLNPKQSALESVKEALWFETDKVSVETKAREVLELVGITGEDVHKLPKHFSGGQRQRIGIARAVISNPDFIVCDEPTSALDVSIQAQIVQLLADLKDKLGLSYLFVTHDLSLVSHISDRIAVMYQGHLVELATTKQLFDNPQHEYTKKLLSAHLSVDPNFAKQQLIDFATTPQPVITLSQQFEWVEVEPNHFVRRGV
ncbi:ABC transporter ATP-binding protein [Carnobacteriaceae bacterium zg-ZUI252]|nr:ABC transporter ATP-binding protein [Carnobacteriaceae bacterium zg-ZUI252]